MFVCVLVCGVGRRDVYVLSFPNVYAHTNVPSHVPPPPSPSPLILHTALVGNVSKVAADVDCGNASSVIAKMGYFLDPNIQIQTVSQRVIRDPGWCSVRWQYSPYAKWVKQVRGLGAGVGF